MGAFEDSGFIIVGLVPDAAQWRFSTPSPSGFPGHRERCLSSCVLCLGVCARPSPRKCGGYLKMRLIWADLFHGPGNLVYYSVFDSFLSISTVAKELQSYLYNRQYQLNLRTSVFFCKNLSSALWLCAKTQTRGRIFLLSMACLWFRSFSDGRIKEKPVYLLSLFTATFWFVRVFIKIGRK